MNSLQDALDRCRNISAEPAENGSLFGPRTIVDPETGGNIAVTGYNETRNQDVLSYISEVWVALERYHDCISDLFFMEALFSPEGYPEFAGNRQIPTYLKIIYQSWLIKATTCFDCTLQAMNSVFELDIPIRDVNRKKFAQKKDSITCPSILQHVESLDLFFKKTMESAARSKSSVSTQDRRNLLVHTNEFEHSVLSNLEGEISFFNLGILDIDPFDLQAGIGSTGVRVKAEVQSVNLEILKQVYPIFEYLGIEYKKRFKGKLIQ